ncbi:hypothetical protein Pla100_50220 [Neorhodopirellula pilleata]|uniref:Uncharacterized protein n=1 Tax=Neorhodopirellula pilleata TaxID=2714738 RepID=A0A5C5ZXA4_9BACT|nr:hypothetical protein Pla100_50220 [Neorhodopirellula pilleata]
MLMPMLSEADPAESAEGSIDPLRIYPTTDPLASRMVPGVRERQQHPRFLMVIAMSLCRAHRYWSPLIIFLGREVCAGICCQHDCRGSNVLRSVCWFGRVRFA